MIETILRRTGIILFWLFLWQAVSWIIHRPIFLVGPWETLLALARLAGQLAFWQAVCSSVARIGNGFMLAFLLGILCGSAAYLWPLFEEILSPVITLIKTIPVASFVILALIWTGAEHLASIISFLVVFPMIYLNTCAGLEAADPLLLEMAQVFHIRRIPKIWHIYRPALTPFLLNACRIALGMCWKSGVAAEVIGTPAHSIGEKLYMAKIFFSTDELFAWTAAVILLSFLFEKLILWVLQYILEARPAVQQNA